MIRFLRDLRLIPIALIASVCLLVLKAADLLLDHNYFPTIDSTPAEQGEMHVTHATPDAGQTGAANGSWAQQMFNFPSASGPAPAPTSALPAIAGIPAPDKSNADITGSIPEKGDKESKEKPGEAAKEAKDAKEAGKEKKEGRGDHVGKGDTPKEKVPNSFLPGNEAVSLPSASERAILGHLQERRQQLDARARELDIREGLIAAAEKRVEARLAELKGTEAQIVAATEKKDQVETARFKGLVTMYENMKARDAAKIFDRLDMEVLIEVASQINPRRMSDILAQMSPDIAERLTVELASRARLVDKSGSELPKIEGRPTTP